MSEDIDMTIAPLIDDAVASKTPVKWRYAVVCPHCRKAAVAESDSDVLAASVLSASVRGWVRITQNGKPSVHCPDCFSSVRAAWKYLENRQQQSAA